MSRSLLVGALAAALLAATADARGPTVVLGSQTSFVPYGKGWGTDAPTALDNGGDPSGSVWQIRWRQWGEPIATGTGQTYVAPTARQRRWSRGRVELRATRLGHCAAHGPRAYTRLEVRVRRDRATRFGAWGLWNDRVNLCHG